MSVTVMVLAIAFGSFGFVMGTLLLIAVALDVEIHTEEGKP